MSRAFVKLAMMGILAAISAEIAGAQTYFTTTGYGDLIAGFRKTGTFTEANELVVNCGNITNLLKLTVGTTINITNYSIVQITNMCPDNLANLQWSVFATFKRLPGITEPYWVTPVGNIPPGTVWLTKARSSYNTQTTSPTRISYSNQGQLRNQILSVSTGASQISANFATNQFNNYTLVTEPQAWDDTQQNTVDYLIEDPTDDTFGDFRGYASYDGALFNVENTTPSPFNSPVRSDLYECSPTNYIDPFTGTNQGPAYYIGYFTMNNADGTMTFTRDVRSVAGNPPPPPKLTITSSLGSGQITSTISFGTTNGATYTLYFTNANGLKTPISNWPTLGMTVSGDGTVHAFTNSSSDLNRFYSVGAQ